MISKYHLKLQYVGLFDETTLFLKSIQCDQKQDPLHYKRGREEVDGIALCFRSKWHLEKGPCSLWTSHTAHVGWFWIDLEELVIVALCQYDYSISCNSLVTLIFRFSRCRLTFSYGNVPHWWALASLTRLCGFFFDYFLWFCVFPQVWLRGQKTEVIFVVHKLLVWNKSVLNFTSFVNVQFEAGAGNTHPHILFVQAHDHQRKDACSSTGLMWWKPSLHAEKTLPLIWPLSQLQTE